MSSSPSCLLDVQDSKKYGGSGTGSKNPDCGGFCERYFQICEAANAFVNPDTPRGAPARRRLVRGDEPDINRLGESAFGSIDDCISACNGYPTPYDPLDYDFTSNQDMFSGGIELFGDTFWCRKYHLDLASDFRTDPYKVQVHCNAAQPSGGGICINSEIGVPLFDADDGETSPLNEINATVYELIRTGYETARHLGYCQLYFHDIVADCTKGGIDDVTLPVALALLPGTVEVIILNNNVGFNGDDPTSGITRFDDGTFNNLLCPTCIRALICDQGNLATIAAGAFAPLINLEMLSLNTNPIKAIPAGMLDPLPLLRELSIANDESFPGRLNSTTIPSNLLFRNPRMRKLTITGHKALSALSISFFKNVNSDLSEMEIIDLSNNGLTNNGDAPTNLPAGMFNNMGKLQYLDLSSNQLTKGDAGWFSAGWGFELRVLKLHNNVITTFEKGIFDTLEKLETVFMHDNDGIIGASIGAFKNNPNLITYTVGKKP